MHFHISLYKTVQKWIKIFTICFDHFSVEAEKMVCALGGQLDIKGTHVVSLEEKGLFDLPYV
jgi:hypothetical protein